MSLTSVWLQTLGDGLVRADQAVGIDVHQTPALTGKAPHWLLDVVLPTPIGSGVRGEWDLTVLHRTLVQTSEEPGDAATVLARLLAQLDAINAAGIIITSRSRDGAAGSARADNPPPTGRGPSRWRPRVRRSGSGSSRSPARHPGTTPVPSTSEAHGEALTLGGRAGGLAPSHVPNAPAPPDRAGRIVLKSATTRARVAGWVGRAGCGPGHAAPPGRTRAAAVSP